MCFISFQGVVPDDSVETLHEESIDFSACTGGSGDSADIIAGGILVEESMESSTRTSKSALLGIGKGTIVVAEALIEVAVVVAKAVFEVPVAGAEMAGKFVVGFLNRKFRERCLIWSQRETFLQLPAVKNVDRIMGNGSM